MNATLYDSRHFVIECRPWSKLRDFVAETIKQVIEGAVTAQDFAKAKNAVVNPRIIFHRANQELMIDQYTRQPVQLIKFDVAITAAEGTKTQGGVAVFAGALGLGSKGQSEKASETVNRIQFSVPVSLPMGAHPSASSTSN
jgi:hypothetical protein